ncbi:MAG: hypothetical protein ACI39E_05630 [Acutalibacteraceae bacterium]
MKKMKKSGLFKTVLICFSLTVLLTSCGMFRLPTTIRCGFSQEMVTMLRDTYELTIPDSAEFIKGYYDNAFRDPAVFLLFEVPDDEFQQIFSENWQYSEYTSELLAGAEMLEIPIEGSYKFKLKGDTYLIFAHTENGRVQCAFHGHGPPQIIA